MGRGRERLGHDGGRQVDNLRYTAAVGAAADTFLGPFYVAYGRADDGHASFYLAMGRSIAPVTGSSIFSNR